MFKKERQFNIISGEKTAFSSQRSLSCAQQRQYFKQMPQQKLQPLKLGQAKDRKQFQYDYLTSAPEQGTRTLTQNSSNTKLLPSMVNYTSIGYNIITHKQQFPTSKVVDSAIFTKRVPEANRQNPLTKHIHAGRLNAPNYHQDYHEREVKGQFIRKRGLCEEVCDNQKGYAMGKYFRKLK